MNYKQKQRKTIFLTILLIILTCIICYYVYNNFNNKKEEVGSITYHYTKNSSSNDSSISLKNAEPETDEIGKVSNSIGKVFNFKVTGINSSNKDIKYEVAVTKNSISKINSKYIKVYLTTVDENNIETSSELTTKDEEVTLYDDLTTSKRSLTNGKKVYEGTIKKDSVNYSQNFKLRIWIDSSAEDNFEDKNFNLKVNIYSTDTIVVEEAKETATASSSTPFEIGDEVTLLDGTKYHVIEPSEEGIGTVTLLSSYNLDDDGEQDSTCTLLNYQDCSVIYNAAEGKLLNEFLTNIKESLNDKSITTRLITKEDIDKLTLTSSNDIWLFSSNYWTSSKVNETSNKYYTIDGTNKIIETSSPDINIYYGTRPVVVVSKTHIIKE